MITDIFEKTRMLWVFPTASKRSPVCIIRFILTKIKNEQHPSKNLRVDEDGALANSTDVINLLIEELKISMETTGEDISWLNGKNEKHNRSIKNMVREFLIDSNQHAKKCCCATETSSEVYK